MNIQRFFIFPEKRTTIIREVSNEQRNIPSGNAFLGALNITLIDLTADRSNCVNIPRDFLVTDQSLLTVKHL
ncbi:hypothetical protein [Niallia taxi]|uniref:hypothetical protein n=1 Tax=Niallia taxi TaxID=2499688 RepID=UPI0012468174|nr:hypothetical protein [Niallia taxi]MCT2347626.1 hypothetical protein [Niallia taxi]MED3962797.1 hypothetical protein [Niallia taxi]